MDVYQFQANEEGNKPKETLDEAIDDIFKNPIYSDIKDALQIAGSSGQASAEESAAYNDILNTIKEHYELSDIKWDEGARRYTATISVDGLERIMDSYYFGERQWEWISPRDGYFADWNVEAFNMELENRLADL